MNRRLLEYKCESFDLSKINNKAYVKRQYNKLLINWYYHKTNNLVNTIKHARNRLKGKWYKTIFDLKISNQPKQELILLIDGKPCKNCAKLSLNDFCSVKCSNRFKSNDLNFKNKLSNSLKEFYQNNPNQSGRNNKIKSSTIEFYNKLNSEEIKKKCTNKNIKYTSFDNLQNRFPDLNFMFDSEFYYNNRYLPVKCKKCNTEFEMTKSTTISRSDCRTCNPINKHKTQTEIFNYISGITDSLVKQNVKNVIDNELDIYIKKLNIAFEYNGLLPHSFGNCKIHYYNKHDIDRTYHLRKTDQCEQNNIQLFHIFENEYTKKKNIWLSMINSSLGNTKRIFARKCVVKEINIKQSSEFINRCHMQGNCNSSVKIGLFYNNKLISVMTFRKHKTYQWEIARMCSELNTTIVGGASKLLKYFERNYNPTSIISYANRRWSQGNLYEQLGFGFVENTPPNYFYFKVNENILYSREKFQKHKLKNLPSYDEKLSEIKNMLNNDYRIIFDSGNKKYIKNYD